jgi:hypothetical protein
MNLIVRRYDKQCANRCELSTILSAVLLLAGVWSAARAGESARGFHILDGVYSDRLASLYRLAAKHAGKPLRFLTADQSMDSVSLFGPEVIVNIKPGAPEDAIAHELMHVVIAEEGYPEPLWADSDPWAKVLDSMMLSDFDHLFINERLSDWGYDAKKGFLSHAQLYEELLKHEWPTNPELQVLTGLWAISELMRCKYYIGATHAEPDILGRFPQISSYWRAISATIDAMPMRPKPLDIWKVVLVYLTQTDRLARDTHSYFMLSDHLFFTPIPFSAKCLSRSANRVFSLEYDQSSRATRVRMKGNSVVAKVSVHPINLSTNIVVRDFCSAQQISTLRIENDDLWQGCKQ